MKTVARYYITLMVAAVIVCLVCAFTTSAHADVESQPNNYTTVTVKTSDRDFTYVDEPITASDFTVAEQIELRRINAPLDQKLILVDTCLEKGADYKAALEVCFPRLIAAVDSAAEYLYKPPVDAQTVYKGNGRFAVTPEVTGRMLDEKKLYASLYCALRFSGGGEVTAHTLPIEPSVKKAELEANILFRGKYTTEYSTSTEARAHNVSLALSKFDGAVIPAGGTLSFNKTVGARTEQNGFKSAKIIVDGKYVDGVGGGVCQASTALYNAALVAGLTCSANAHSICPSYCPAGLDAMISGMSDLVITNTTAHDVYIAVNVANKRGTVTVFGEKNEYTIVPESVIVKTVKHEESEQVDTEHKYFDSTAVSGDRALVSPGKDGVVSETFLKYYKNGTMVKRVKIRSNEYKAVPQIIAVNP
ncbi:MAG: hypothetical protein HDT28_02610 [Clostridiales bacterium]|nr:hypothetical protein [Clostridiales bacterium]